MIVENCIGIPNATWKNFNYPKLEDPSPNYTISWIEIYLDDIQTNPICYSEILNGLRINLPHSNAFDTIEIVRDLDYDELYNSEVEDLLADSKEDGREQARGYGKRYGVVANVRRP